MSLDYSDREELEILKSELQKKKALDVMLAKQEQETSLAHLQQQLQPEQLENLYRDHERRARLEHNYKERERDAQHERERDSRLHGLEVDIIKEKLLLKLRKKHGVSDSLSDSDLSKIIDGLNKASE